MPAGSSVLRQVRDSGSSPRSALLFLLPVMLEKTINPLIAVVDDDQSLARSLARFLKASGFDSVVYRSAEAFLADKQHDRFDCLIVDQQLGGISGIDLQKCLRSAGENTRMILMTARDEKELDVQGVHHRSCQS